MALFSACEKLKNLSRSAQEAAAGSNAAPSNSTSASSTISPPPRKPIPPSLPLTSTNCGTPCSLAASKSPTTPLSQTSPTSTHQIPPPLASHPPTTTLP